MEQLPDVKAIGAAIVVVRGQRVMLDADLARLYGVETRRLNQQVRRNPERFPSDFMFELSLSEWRGMRLQNASVLRRSKTPSPGPIASTEHGCLMPIFHVPDQCGGARPTEPVAKCDRFLTSS